MKRWYTICSLCVLAVLFIFGLGDFFSTNRYIEQSEQGKSETQNFALIEDETGGEQDNPVYSNQNPASPTTGDSDRRTEESEESVEEHYLMKLHNGTVCVYYGEEATLWMDTQISEDDITSDAREKLTEGVYVNNIWDVYSYLESYTS